MKQEGVSVEASTALELAAEAEFAEVEAEHEEAVDAVAAAAVLPVLFHQLRSMASGAFYFPSSLRARAAGTDERRRRPFQPPRPAEAAPAPPPTADVVKAQ